MIKRITAFFLIVALLILSVASAVGGTVSDPVVTKSYLTDIFKPQIFTKAQSSIDASFNALRLQLDRMFGANAVYAGIYASSYLSEGNATFSSDGKSAVYLVAPGTIIAGKIGTTITLTSGSAVTYTPNGDVIVNISEGEAYLNRNNVIMNNQYMVADLGVIGIKTTSEAMVAVSGDYLIIGHAVKTSTNDQSDITYKEHYTNYAHALNVLGLFKGTNNGFELTRSATRTEALVMLIRILGEEKDALAYSGKHPFKDVPAWADRYVAYGYKMGYTKGISATKFGSNENVTQLQYFTFLLRTLGYNDGNGDFVWDKSNLAAVNYGILTSMEEFETRNIFYRDHVVFTSYKTLYAKLKGSNDLLINKLVDKGTVTVDAVYQASVIAG